MFQETLSDYLQQQTPQQLEIFVEQMMNGFPASVHLKDAKKFSYLKCNHSAMHFYHLNKQEEYLGRTIFDLSQNMDPIWQKGFVDEIHERELEIVNTGKPLIAYGENFLDSQGRIRFHSLNKFPIMNINHEVYAILTIALPEEKNITHEDLRKLYQKIYLNKKTALTKFLQHLGLTQFIADPIRSRLGISERELDCLILLASGKTLKEVGARLNLSYRTVESNIEHIKQKCHFISTSEMIEAFFLHYFKS